jgi:hypothetical protein
MTLTPEQQGISADAVDRAAEHYRLRFHNYALADGMRASLSRLFGTAQ